MPSETMKMARMVRRPMRIVSVDTIKYNPWRQQSQFQPEIRLHQTKGSNSTSLRIPIARLKEGIFCTFTGSASLSLDFGIRSYFIVQGCSNYKKI
jgi:hypothetical protein